MFPLAVLPVFPDVAAIPPTTAVPPTIAVPVAIRPVLVRLELLLGLLRVLLGGLVLIRVLELHGHRPPPLLLLPLFLDELLDELRDELLDELLLELDLLG